MDQIATKPKDLKSEDDCKEKILSEIRNSLPLLPKIDKANDSNVQNTRKSCEDDLLGRLTNAISKQIQYERSVNATWFVDNTVLHENLKNYGSIKGAQLPKHVEENIKGVAQSAEDYISKLEEQLQDLDCADNQIINSANKTLQDIDEAYQSLINEVCREINRKRDLLKLETEVHKNEGLAPLKACRQEVNAQIRSTRHLLDLVQAMLKYPHTFNRQRFEQLLSVSSNLGRIPAVPLPEELPCITFCHPLNAAKEKVLTKVTELGCVSRIGPVQLLEIEERPASLYIKWHVVDLEYSGEEQIFIVQKATGDNVEYALNNFETVYEGFNTACFVRDLSVNTPVTIRVGIQAPHTVWSNSRTAKTTLAAYCWDLTNKNYMITNSGKVAAKITNEISTLFSQEAQFDAEHIVEFKFLEASTKGSNDEGIALVSDSGGSDDDLKRKGALLITPQGKIFMDGEKKLMRLPKIRFGARILFSASRKDEESLRINIECADKAVTYDWIVQTPLYFAARFTEFNKWNIIVK